MAFIMSQIYTLEDLQIETLQSPYELKQELPAMPHHLEFVQETRRQIARILNGEDSRLLLIMGPCSIHDLESATEYASRLKQLSEEVSKHFLVIMRTYFEKPRTALGWKGMLYDPHLDGSNDMITGLKKARTLLLKLADMNVASATEFLDPATSRYMGDLISWACIGARTAESQVHRQLASGLPMPIAFKNSTSGCVDVAINGVISASTPHACFGFDDCGQIALIRTRGNRNAHIVLRGSEEKPNYDAASIARVIDKLQKVHLQPKIIIDCSHGNSSRNYEEQINVFKSVIEQNVEGNSMIKGVIVESHLFAGSQSLRLEKSRLQYAVSITDPCLDWPATKELIHWGTDLLEQKLSIPFTTETAVKAVDNPRR
jgi:3-deoxy-7-phosphoheptulonate synthase